MTITLPASGFNVSHEILKGRFTEYNLVDKNGDIVCPITESQYRALTAAFEDPCGEKKKAARQDVVNTIGSILFQAQYDAACIVQQISELAEAAAELDMEENEPLNMAEEVTDDIPFF